MGIRTIYIMLEESGEAWVKEYSLKKFKPPFIEIREYPETMLTDPLNHKMITVEEGEDVWYELVYEPRELSSED